METPERVQSHFTTADTKAVGTTTETRASGTVVHLRNSTGVLQRMQVQAKSQTHSLWQAIRANARSYLLGLLSLSALTLFWYLATHYRVDFYIRFGNIPDPASVFESLIRMSHTDSVFQNIIVSVRRVFIGFAIAAILGVASGLVIGRYTLARDLLFPVFEVLRPVPAIAWVPMAIMLWPTSESSIVFITFLGAFFPIVLNTYQGVRDLDPVLVRAARSLGAGEGALLREVILPGALPHIFTGLALGMGVAWVSLIAAEMISGQFGIGYFTWEAYSLIQYADIAVGMMIIGLLGLLSSALIRFAGRIVMPWVHLHR
ncbi:ABC transporter permease [Thermithiobacillus plumbiphilus]|uniref:ABC transporter permease n=1 Tax=Thermithiobacillus plumbiphilus TaxID=1729899 RepID=A0ABU9D9A4_9PROT